MASKTKQTNKKRVHLITLKNPKLPVNEQYRLIRYNIQFSSVDKEIKTIVITSPEPSDGKSTIAANLAVVLAQQGYHILLADADLRKPSVHYSFEESNIDGLTSVLTKTAHLKEATKKTYVPNLDILTSGPLPPNPTELLDSRSLEKLLEELKGSYDYIIFDTPPVLAVTDAQILANKCDGVILILGSRKTLKEHALKTKALLSNTKGKLLGVVLNRVEGAKDEYYY